MPRIFLAVLFAQLLVLPVAAQVDPAAPKEAVTLEINADLLRRAQALHIDLAAMLEAQLASAFADGGDVAPAAMSHHALISAAFDTFEGMMFAPTLINQASPSDAVRTVCQSMGEDVDKLVGYAGTRQAMAEPTTLDEARTLDEYLAGRFQAMQTRMGEVGQQLQSGVKRLQADCPDMNQDESRMVNAMNTALAKYGPNGWCKLMRKKPQSEWTMDDGGKFAEFCTGLQPN